jgi:hypothetical protein
MVVAKPTPQNEFMAALFLSNSNKRLFCKCLENKKREANILPLLLF